MDKCEEIKKVSVVIPVYNEEQSLVQLLDRTIRSCKQLTQDYELILVDDGSSDHSTSILIKAAENLDNNVIVIILNRNYGQHSAIIAGFNQADGNLVITLDADLQNPPEEIPRLVQTASEGYDVVGTYRTYRQDSWFRKKASKIINAMITKVTGCSMGDYGCMLRAYRRHIIDAMLQCNERSTFIPILANIFAQRIIEIDVIHAERKFGNSKYNLMNLINLMYDLLTCLTTTPLRLLSVVGAMISVGGFLLAVLLIVVRLVFNVTWADNGVFTLFAILFMFIGAQFFSMGLLGEYIGRIYNDVRARPRYFIQKVISIGIKDDIKKEEK
ncbi:undecaprenyl-phosphate 4-deoxy-4-formamido-L-arabinose transferase [Candidatus Hartigia pinicola]